MKVFLASAGIITCLLLLIFLGVQPSANQFHEVSEATVKRMNVVVDQDIKDEFEIVCGHQPAERQVLRIRHRWIVSEYADGRIESDHTRDTISLGIFGAQEPCPSVEESYHLVSVETN
ncbi:MAG: hypothetical protein AAGI38_13550 [Bacteroidota bacterium]